MPIIWLKKSPDHQSNITALLEKARQVAERFTASSNPLLLDTLGWVYFRQGRAQDAVSLFQRAAGLGLKLPAQFHYHYGAALVETGARGEAQTELRQAVVKDANYPGRDDANKLLAQTSK